MPTNKEKTGENLIVESYETEEWQSVANLREEKSKYQGYARATFRKDRRVNIRLTEKDLVDLQLRALEEGIPYQTLMASILHKYVTGRLVEQS
jgi:predicted DNA binding CopG/RHH family protein